MRKRFLSEHIDFIASDENLEPPKSPPTPKIQPLKLAIEEDLEELFLGESDDFQSDRNRNFSIQFSSTAEEFASPTEKEAAGVCPNPTTRDFRTPRLERIRSKSLHKPPSVGLIYDFLHSKFKKY